MLGTAIVGMIFDRKAELFVARSGYSRGIPTSSSSKFSRLSQRLDGSDREGVNLVFGIADGNILARPERMRPKPVSGFIVVIRRVVIVEYPARMFLSSRLMHQLANLVLFAGPEALHPTGSAIGLPRRCVDMAVWIKRCNELVPVPS